MTKIVVGFVILGISCLWADESINAQIEALQHLPPQERVTKMNHLKQQIANMNEEERLKVLEQLQSTQGSLAQRSQVRMRQGIHASPTNMMQQQYHQNNISPMKRQGR